MMNILAIETSCDDTCLAILKVGSKNSKLKSFKILANIVSSQFKIHQKYGGVYPFLAKREHQKNLPIIFQRVFNKAKKPKIDLIAVTIGPGLEPCLWTGINFAKELAEKLKVPILPVNHIEAHIIANFLGKNGQLEREKGKLFPAICLIVSGGHSQLILMKGFGKYKILGETRDDAAGECFDKTARILGLGYPGGPAISAEAAKCQIPTNNKFLGGAKIRLPRPMIHQKNYDFSFAGLKTAVLYDFQKRSKKERESKEYIQAMAREIEGAIVEVLVKKTIKAAKEFGLKTIILGGGVAANEKLRQQFRTQSKKLKLNLLVPPKNLSTDNGAMVALAGYFSWLRKKGRKEIKAYPNLRLK